MDALFEVIIEGFDAEVRVVFKCIVYVGELVDSGVVAESVVWSLNI